MATKRATTLRLIRHIAFDASYKDVVLFDSADEQYDYFNGLMGLEFEEYSYQRTGANYLKVKSPMQGIWRYCYLMFKNASHEDKWWYAFIDSVDYINESTTGIRFHIDVMQSYMFDYKLGQSFVVREHSATDNPGDNIVPENLNFGHYLYDYEFHQLEVPASETPFGWIGGNLTQDDMCVVIAINPALFDITDSPVVSSSVWKEQVYSGVYQGIRFICIPLTPKMGEEKLKQTIADLDGLFGVTDMLTAGGVINTYMMPIIFLPTANATSWNNTRRYVGFDAPTHLDGYTPKNKKLLTYPYMAINVSNGRTAGCDYAYEYFLNRSPGFSYEGNLCLTPSSICYPVGYKGKVFATDEGVTIDSFPLAVWGQDGVSEWMSNHMFQAAVGFGMTAAALACAPALAPVAGFVGMPPATGGSGGSSTSLVPVTPGTLGPVAPPTITGVFPEVGGVDTQRGRLSWSDRALIGMTTAAAGTPPVTHGVGGSGDLLYGNPYGKGMCIYRKFICAEFARKLDTYFTKYGYAVNEIKQPNLKNRKYWNYVELSNPNIVDIDLPMNDLKIIMGVYERGVTFWRPNAKIGDYENQNNSL